MNNPRSLAHRLRSLPPRVFARLAYAGIVLVFLFFLAFGLWVAFTTQQAVDQVNYSHELREDYDRAQDAISSEESLERKYRLEPAPEWRDKHQQAADELVDALQNILISA